MTITNVAYEIFLRLQFFQMGCTGGNAPEKKIKIWITEVNLSVTHQRRINQAAAGMVGSISFNFGLVLPALLFLCKCRFISLIWCDRDN
jgi:hypothetical protein